MELEVGKIYEGKVTGITKFGAFVELEPGKTGMVHISEIANTFVNDIREHLTDGQEVKVKVLAVNDDGKVSLSIKKALEPPPQQHRDFGNNKRPYNNGGNNGNSGGNRRFNNPRQQEASPSSPEEAFENMLNRFKQTSEERIGDLKKNVDNKRRSQSRRK